MASPARRVWSMLALVLCAGCMRSCDCGQGAQSGDAPKSDPTGLPVPAKAPTAGSGPTIEGPARPRLDPVKWTPAPDSKETRALIAAKKQIDESKALDKPVDPALVGSILTDKVGSLTADGALNSSEREGSNTSIAIAARNYKVSGMSVRVKVIDTANSPEARKAVAEHLDVVGNEAVGHQRGVFVKGAPAVIANFAKERVSRANALVANRYLVQVMVNDAEKADDALTVLEQLDLGKLVAAKPGKAKKP